MCGTLSEAHVATHPGPYLRQKSKKGKDFARKFIFDSVANTVLLCHNFHGACHGQFDDHLITLVPRLFSTDWAVIANAKSTCWRLLPECEGNDAEAIRKRRPDFDFKGNQYSMKSPYRRVLADRYQEFLRKCSRNDEKLLENYGQVRALSEEASADEGVESPLPPAKRIRTHA
eukprot:1994037-Amphidinium_carterae.1